jgi:hypothetical protein
VTRKRDETKVFFILRGVFIRSRESITRRGKKKKRWSPIRRRLARDVAWRKSVCCEFSESESSSRWREEEEDDDGTIFVFVSVVVVVVIFDERREESFFIDDENDGNERREFWKEEEDERV